MIARSPKWFLLALFVQFTLLVILYKFFVQSRLYMNDRRALLRKSQIASLELSKHVDWQSVPRKRRPPQSEFHDKWIVLTTVNPPTEDVKKLSRIGGWKVVVVGDTKTPRNWRFVVFSCANITWLCTKKKSEDLLKTRPVLPVEAKELV